MSRRALLLAIADYDPLDKLSYVRNDAPRLAAALSRAGFLPHNIKLAGAGAGESLSRELTTTRLREAIGDFLDDGSEQDDLLVFFSGHGVELNGRRVLLPQDFTPKRPGSATELVSDGWISAYARGCRARSILVLIDACREGARYELAAAKSSSPTDEDIDAPLRNEYTGDATDGPTLVFVYSCASGEQSARDVRGTDYSAFTRAFAEAIELENGPASVVDIAADALRRLDAYSNGLQTLTNSGCDGRAGQWRQLVIKEDEAARFRDRLARSDWSRRITETSLFNRLQATLPAFATQLRAIACARKNKCMKPSVGCRYNDGAMGKHGAAKLTEPSTYFSHGRGYGEVPAAEIAVMLAVPFIYEAVLATAEIRLAAAGSMPDPEAAVGSDYMVNAWRNAWRESDAAQARRSLLARNQADAADDQACWALVRFCHTFGELWDAHRDAHGRSGWAFDAVTDVVAPAPLPEVINDHRVCEILSVPRLLRLARLMHAGFDDVTIDAVGGNHSLEPRISSGELLSQLTISEVRLAHLLNLGFRLALDLRRMPPLLAEHVGTDQDL